jgi:hypothetical protein
MVGPQKVQTRTTASHIVHCRHIFTTMSSLPGQLDFAATEEEICQEWKTAETFATQNRLALERGDEVRPVETCVSSGSWRFGRTLMFFSCLHRLVYPLELIDIEIYLL